jgi:hypothetical protein
MRVVFLDFDGPIIPIQSHENKRGLMEKAWPPCITALNRITDATGAKIVISSSWRWGGKPDAKMLLALWGATGEVIGITPILETAWKPDNKLWVGIPRGREIAAWLAANTVESFVIIDDDKDMEHLLPHLLHTPFEIGLTEADADRAIQMLRSTGTST